VSDAGHRLAQRLARPRSGGRADADRRIRARRSARGSKQLAVFAGSSVRSSPAREDVTGRSHLRGVWVSAGAESARRAVAGTSNIQPDRQLTTGGLTPAQRGALHSSVSESDATSAPSSRAAAASVSGSMSVTVSLALRNMGRSRPPRRPPTWLRNRSPFLPCTADPRRSTLHPPPTRPTAACQPGRRGAGLHRHVVRHELGARQGVSLDDDSHSCHSGEGRDVALLGSEFVTRSPSRSCAQVRQHSHHPPVEVG
jgi:hypothetical protein